MLSEKIRKEKEETFDRLLLTTKVEGIENLIEWLHTTDFYTAPASTRFHGSYPGGLLVHSLAVYLRLMQIVPRYDENNKIKVSSIIICSLLHDVCKIYMYKESTRNQKNEETGVWEKVPCYAVDDKFPYGGHGSKSVYYISRFIKLSFEEASAINCHMGAWDMTNYSNPSNVYSSNLLAWLLHVADEAATYIDKT